MPVNVPLSVLDLARVFPNETSPRPALDRIVRLAQTADRVGFERIWFAEHHNMPTIASSSPALLIQLVASQTERIRVGAGGVMLPNHSPLVAAEQFGTLEALFPGRIDLGLGRAPGTDRTTILALRRDGREAERFPDDVIELAGFLGEESHVPGVIAWPGRGSNVPLYILGSSLFGARLAAGLGLPYAFASHFAPAMLHEAAAEYRGRFNEDGPLAKPGAKPHFIAAINAVASDDAETANEQRRNFENEWLRSTAARGRALSQENLDALREAPQGRQVLSMLQYSVSGTQEQVITGLNEFADQVRADELIIVNLALDEDAQHRSMELLAP